MLLQAIRKGKYPGWVPNHYVPLVGALATPGLAGPQRLGYFLSPSF